MNMYRPLKGLHGSIGPCQHNQGRNVIRQSACKRLYAGGNVLCAKAPPQYNRNRALLPYQMLTHDRYSASERMAKALMIQSAGLTSELLPVTSFRAVQLRKPQIMPWVIE